MIVHTNLRVSPWTPMMHSIFQIIRGLIHLPSEIDNVKSGLTRSKRKHEPSRYGASQCWVPAGTELISKNYHVRLKNSAAISKNLDNLFGCEKSCFSREALTTMAAFNLHNYGGSDEVTEIIIAGAFQALFYDIGSKCDHASLGKCCPSQRTIAQSEMNLATDCLMEVIQEVIDDGTKDVVIITDHGHRGGQDHFVVVICWAGLDTDGKRIVKHLCPSIDKAGHTPQKAANAIKQILERFLPDGVNVKFLTADSGGGGAIQFTTPVLVRMQVIKDASNEANCTLHGSRSITLQ